MLYQVNTIIQAKQQTLDGESRFNTRVSLQKEGFMQCDLIQPQTAESFRGWRHRHWQAEVVTRQLQFSKASDFLLLL